MAYSGSKIITNVGYLKEHTVANRVVTYLAVIQKDGINKFFLTVPREATTIEGVAMPKGWVFLDKSFANGTATLGTLTLAGGVKELISQDLVNQDISGLGSQVKPEYLVNGAALLAATNIIVPGVGNDFPTMPAILSRRGEGITEEQVTDLLNLNNDILPNETGTITSALTVTPTTTARLADTSIDKDPIAGVKNFFKNPIEYAKAAPISAAIMVVGIWDLGANVTGQYRPILIGKNSMVLGGGKKKFRRA